MDKTLKYAAWLVIAAPIIAIIFTWDRMPESVPVHYNINGEVDRYGSRAELLFAICTLVVVNLLVYLLLNNLHRIDPKRKYKTAGNPGLKRLSFAIVILITTIAGFIIYMSINAMTKMNVRVIAAVSGVFIAVIGNYIYSIKPNYFAGIRTPWTLENGENWRLTHILAGKLWVFGGLLIALLAFLLPLDLVYVGMLILIGIIVIIPIVFSYTTHRRLKKEKIS